MLSFALTLAFLGPASAAALALARDAAFAFLVGAAIAGALPRVRDRLRTPIRIACDLALVVLVGAAVAGAVQSVFPVAIALALAVAAAGMLAAFGAARAGGGDAASAVLGSGTRDFAVASAIAGAALPSAAAVPLMYGAILFALAALGVLARRRNLGERR